MNESSLEILIDGARVAADTGATVAATMLNAGVAQFRSSPSGGVRAPVCGMGVCFECRVTIDGVPHQRACMVTVRAGMSVQSARASR